VAKRRRSGFTAPLSALSLTLLGCASAGTSITQTIRIETPGCATARCELRNDRGQWTLAATPGTVTLATSDAPLQVSCRAADGVLNTVGAQGSARPLTGGGGVVGGVAGGAAMGAAVGATALAFIPVLGILVLATGAAAGAVTGQTIESHARALRYPEQIDVPMSCPLNPTVTTIDAPAARLGVEVRGLFRTEVLSAGLGDRGGVLVSSVTGSGRAAIAGLRQGDVILKLDGHDLKDAAQFEEGVRVAAGAPLSLTIWRKGEVHVLLLAAGEARP